MAKRKRPAPDLPLFDLPLHPEEDSKPGTAGSEPEAVTPAEEETEVESEPDTPDRDTSDRDTSDQDGSDESPEQPELFSTDESPAEETPDSTVTTAPLGERLRAGLADLTVHLLMLAVAVTAAYRLGTRVTWEFWPPFAVLALVFSFLYWMIPLAFWGQTPGMAWVGHIARGLGDEPLTFQQTFLRWIGALLTCGLAGLPLLLTLSGRSLSDRLSRSRTIIV